MDLEELSKSDTLFDGHYKLLRPLSTDGGTADVWLAIDVNTIDIEYGPDEMVHKDEDSGMLLAIKIYRPKNMLDVDGEQRFRDEFKIVYECRHENLLQPTSFSIYKGIPYLVLPFCKFGSSEQLLGKSLTNDEIWKLIFDVASGLNRLHTNQPPIIHQDIKPANILIDNTRNYAITDFGISSRSGDSHDMYYDTENSGTLAYMSPERFGDNAEPMAQSDIWAFGATLCEILTGNVPFGEEGGLNQMEKNLPMPVIHHVSSDIQRLIHACLAKEPDDRPSALELRNAAQAKQFPAKSKRRIYYIALAVGFLFVFIILLLIFRPKPVVDKTPDFISSYNNALQLMNCGIADSLKIGIKNMEELSNKGYIPAMYELAFTYGWYSDSASVKRKLLLGIDVYQKGDSKFMPKSDVYSHKALALFQRIIELNDSAYAAINANSAYRIACYYVTPNNVFKAKYKEGKNYLEISKDWAMQANDTILLSKIMQGLNSIDKYNENDK
jgi:hypothetical protein